MKRAIFKLPGESNFILSKNENETTSSVLSLVSFLGDKERNMGSSLLHCSHLDLLDPQFFRIEELPEFQVSSLIPPTKEHYLKKIEEAMQVVQKEKLEKLVISRIVKKEYSTLDLQKTYLNLCETYPNSLCYLWVDDPEIWIGATPELLAKYNKNTGNFETMSLAGTLPIDEEWTNKEIEEQQSVSDYIKSILGEYATKMEVSKTKDLISGNIKHLKTSFKAKIASSDVEELVHRLHPTPAICGIPKDICLNYLSNIEQYNRGFYSGLIKIDTPEEVYYFVNLRCAQIFKNIVIAYAGGGITTKSNPEKEWQETELKSEAILNHLL